MIILLICIIALYIMTVGIWKCWGPPMIGQSCKQLWFLQDWQMSEQMTEKRG